MKTYIKAILVFFILTLFIIPADAQKRKAAKKTVVVDPVQKKYDKYCEMPILNVMFTDSTSIKIEQITEHIALPEHVGRLICTEDGIGYENDFAGIRLITKKNSSGKKRIYQQFMIGKEWSEPTEIVIDDEFVELCSPWLMPDGQTLYFAGIEVDDEEEEDEEQANTYSLFTSMLNTSTHEFMKPQKLPIPLNGDGNNLCYIEDEIDNVAWFVTTRNQGKDNVALYTLKPHEPWEYYDNQTLSKEKLVSLSELQKISDTWESVEKRKAELQRVAELTSLYAPKDQKKVLFVLANGKEITDASQLSSATAKALLRRYLELQDSINSTHRQLDEYRTMYHNSKASARQPLSNTILSLEKKLQELHQQLRSISNELKVAK